MAVTTYDQVLHDARQLAPEEQAQLIEELEDAADVRAFDAAQAALDAGEEEAIPFEQAMAEIDAHRQRQAS